MEGLSKDIIFTRYRLESCLIIIGGIITDEEKKVLFGESALSERQNVKGLQKGHNKTLKLHGPIFLSYNSIKYFSIQAKL